VAAPLDRRQFLGRSLTAGVGLIAVGGGASSLLAACSSDKKTTSASGTTLAGGSSGTVAPGSLGKLAFQLSWIKNVEFAGSFIADTNGIYKANGFSDVNLISGGPSVTQDAVVASGSALVCTSAPDITSPAILQGADIIAIGAQYQKNPFAIMSLATNPIPTPQDMIGKKIGVQATNTSAWTSFLKANSINESDLTTVPVEFNPQPLTTGTVDGWFSFITNEPIALKEQGFDTVTFLLNDYKYPLVSQIYVVQTSSLTQKRDQLKAFLKSEIMGWHESLKNPQTGADLAANVYGKDQNLDAAEQGLESIAQNKLILDDRTKTEGIFTVPQSMIDATVATLAIGGVDIAGDKLFDMSVLTEVYQENPDLMKSPV
jgi:ABC-type nitrate/sulfonate/bicarbonate transport system substrate-binding protein